MPVIKRQSDYYVAYTYGGRRFREKVGKNKRIAVKVLNKVKAEISAIKKSDYGSL